MQLLRLFDQLIANVDRNLGNLIITKDWNIWAIDHTRAFRTNPTLKTPGNIARCDRQVFARLKQLDKPTLSQAVGRSLQSFEIDAILKRRDAIVAMIEQRGESGLFDRLDDRVGAAQRRTVPSRSSHHSSSGGSHIAGPLKLVGSAPHQLCCPSLEEPACSAPRI